MAYARPRQSWQRQPEGWTGLNYSHPLAPYLARGFLHNFAMRGGRWLNVSGARGDVTMNASGWLGSTGPSIQAPNRTFYVNRAANGSPGYIVGTGTTAFTIPSG